MVEKIGGLLVPADVRIDSEVMEKWGPLWRQTNLMVNIEALDGKTTCRLSQ
jgi:hypothetical protein